ncbi:hypothetical protein GCM10010520_18110 [Rhizobium viscosum]|uniref:Sulfur globule protein n=1 Tax=Rhizobium viscosum TaxID=1673 RepID=A0ABR9IX17_RHIVS|nr:hypothetical protein [Rhizobium viscosum]
MSMLRKIAATGLISLTLAVGSIATVTPALAHGGGGGHGGGGHEEGGHMGGEHMGGFGMGHFDREGNRGAFFAHDRFDGRFRDRGPFFLGSNDDYDRCYWQWDTQRPGHPVRTEVCY